MALESCMLTSVYRQGKTCKRYKIQGEGLESYEIYRSEVEQLEMVAKDLHHDKCVHRQMFATREEHANTNTDIDPLLTQGQDIKQRFSWRNAKTKQRIRQPPKHKTYTKRLE